MNKKMNKKRAAYLTWKLWEEAPNSPVHSNLSTQKQAAAETQNMPYKSQIIFVTSTIP